MDFLGLVLFLTRSSAALGDRSGVKGGACVQEIFPRESRLNGRSSERLLSRRQALILAISASVEYTTARTRGGEAGGLVHLDYVPSWMLRWEDELVHTLKKNEYKFNDIIFPFPTFSLSFSHSLSHTHTVGAMHSKGATQLGLTSCRPFRGLGVCFKYTSFSAGALQKLCSPE